jgi:hypothetical protein
MIGLSLNGNKTGTAPGTSVYGNWQIKKKRNFSLSNNQSLDEEYLHNISHLCKIEIEFKIKAGADWMVLNYLLYSMF